MSLVLLLGIMLAGAAIGLPLVFALLGASVLTLMIVRPEIPLVVVPQLFMSGINSYTLLAVALFFFTGELMTAGGVIDRILGFAKAMVGHVRGGLAQVTVLSSVIMAGISGSAIADAAALGPVLIRSMKKDGYPPGYAAALVQTASTIGPIIPPSIPMILYAVIADESVGDMFMAGIVPGLIMAAGLSFVAYVTTRKMGLAVQARAGIRVILSASARAFLALLAPVIIVGGIRGGIFTPTEAGAVAVAYIFLITTLAFRALTIPDILNALVRAARGTATVLVVLGASSIFAWIIADQKIGHQLAAAMTALDLPNWALLLAINVLFFLIGMFVEPLPALVIFVPVFLPLMAEIGMDTVQFGVMVILNLIIGLCTPPIGILIYMTADIAETTAWSVIRFSVPFLVVLIGVVLLITFVPALTLALPEFSFGGGR